MTTMPTTLSPASARPGRALRWGAIVGALTTLTVLALVSVLVSGHNSRASAGHGRRSAMAGQRVQLAQWEAGVRPLILSAGQVVALGPRQGVQQLQSHEFSAATNQHMAAGWVARLRQLRTELHSLKAPRFLSDAQSLLDQSLAGYITASQNLLAATTATGSQRASLLNDADVAGRAADRLYDQATAAIAAWRATLGLPVDWSGSS
jgi:hypothetical protein